MAGKYFIQYAFSAAGSATALPLINAIGVGAACTLSMSYTSSLFIWSPFFESAFPSD